jgi:hypothetical protein
VFVRTTKSKAAAAARIGTGVASRKLTVLLASLRVCFARTEPWLQAEKYVSALVSEIPKRNGWTIAEYVGDRSPDRTQRLLNREYVISSDEKTSIQARCRCHPHPGGRRGRRASSAVIWCVDGRCGGRRRGG